MKKPPLTKGPDGPKVKTKHVQVQRGLAIKILGSYVPTEYDICDGIKVPVIYESVLVETIKSLGYEPKSMIAQLLKSGYLVVKDKEPDAVSFYIVTIKEAGRVLQGKKSKKAA